MSRKPWIGREYEFDAQYGLPEALPAGEQLLWQGSPDARALARRVFHVNKVAVYFVLLLAWRVASSLHDGARIDEALQAGAWMALAFGLALWMLLLLARWTAESSVYTLTDRRIVLRIGIVLTVAYNLPLSRIEGAALHDAGGGCSDIALALEPETRIAWLQLWPHARPWRVARPQPMLRALRDGPAVASLLSQAWVRANPQVGAFGDARPTPRPARITPQAA